VSGDIHFHASLNIVKQGREDSGKALSFESEDFTVVREKKTNYYWLILNFDFPKKECPYPHDLAYFTLTRTKPRSGNEYTDKIFITNMVFDI